MRNDYTSGSSVTEMLTDLQWMPLEERRRNARLHMLDKIAGGRVAINLEDYVVQRINTRTRSTNSVKLRHIGARTVSYKNSTPFFHEQ